MTKSNCLNEDSLTSYLEGLLSEPARTAAEEHLVDCDECRSQLVYYMRILDEDVLDEEESVVREAMAAIEGARADRGPAKAAPVKDVRPVAASGGRSWPVRWLAVAAAALLAVAAGWFVSDSGEPTADEIVAALLSDSRPFESRLSEQPYRALFETRGPGDRPEPAALEDEMRRRAATDYMMGTFYLVNEDFDQAIAYLRDAAGSARDARVYNNLGVAYLERNSTDPEQRVIDLNRARERLEQAVAVDPDFTPAVYNLALLFQRQNLPAEARAQARRYLELDPESPWAAEIRTLARVTD